jgi:phosphoribosylaminoimidazole-succinocarboxamide synthase
MEALTSLDLPLPKFRSGKVREVFDLGDAYLMVATDRVSAFDVVMPNGIPEKGRILNQLSLFWFDQFSSVIENHLIAWKDEDVKRVLGDAFTEALVGRSMIVKKCEPILIESVARAYIAGSLYKEYVSAGGKERPVNIHGIDFPDGLELCGKLPTVIFTPATKAQEGHDENISFDSAKQIAGDRIAEICRDTTIEIFQRASEICDQAGIILADTKLEFGVYEDNVILIDEVLTPDSSRFWPKSEYVPGRAQDSLDKQYIRDYLETLDWDKTPPAPVLPQSVVTETRNRYIDIFRRITGRDPELLA